VNSWIKKNSLWQTFPNVQIGPNKLLKSSVDLGDIDILVINEKNDKNL